MARAPSPHRPDPFDPRRLSIGGALALVVLLAGPTLDAQPINDDCTAPIEVLSLPFLQTVDLGMANPTAIIGCIIDDDAWYAHTATEELDLHVRVDSGATFSSYRIAGGTIGLCPSDTDRIVCALGDAVVPVAPGDLLLVQVLGGGTGVSALSIDAIPDRCATASEILALPFATPVVHAELSAEPGFPACPAAEDLWYVHRPTTDGTLLVGGVPAGPTTEIAVFEVPSSTSTACPPASALVACGGTLATVPATVGNDYWIRVSSPSSTSPGSPGVLEVDWLDTVGNDACANAIPIAVPDLVSVELLVATDSPAGGCPLPNDVWYRLTAPASGLVEVLATGSIGVYLDAGCPGTLLACGANTVVFDAAIGTDYHVRFGDLSPGVLESLETRFAPPTFEDRYRFRIPPVEVPPGANTTMVVEHSSETTSLGVPEPVQGLSVAVCIDPLAVSIVSAELGADALVVHGGSPPDFWSANIEPVGFFGLLVNDFFGQFDFAPLGTYELYLLGLSPSLPPGGGTLLQFCDGTLGPALTDNLVVIDGNAVSPILTAGELAVRVGTPFRRGDPNLDGTVNIADAITILGALFVPGSDPLPCPLAADGNDDESVNIADAIAVLNALFIAGGPALPPPGCGADPTPGGLDCPQPASCP